MVYNVKKTVILAISDNAGNINITLLTNLGLFCFNGTNRLSIPRTVWEEIDSQILGIKKNEVNADEKTRFSIPPDVADPAYTV